MTSAAIENLFRPLIAQALRRDALVDGQPIEVHLNMHANYLRNWRPEQGFRELVSNWLDQLNTQSQLLNAHNHQDKVVFSAKSGDSRNINAEFGGIVIGKIIVTDSKIELINLWSSIPPSALELGCTSKNGQDDSIGVHGEGLKGGANCLLRAEFKVLYKTHGEEWTFEERV